MIKNREISRNQYFNDDPVSDFIELALLEILKTFVYSIFRYLKRFSEQRWRL